MRAPDGGDTDTCSLGMPPPPMTSSTLILCFSLKDTLGGGFDATQAFVGELAHFNIWDRKLTPGEVYNLATCSTKALSGNVIAWSESHIEIDLKGNLPEVLVICPLDKSIALPTKHISLPIQSPGLKRSPTGCISTSSPGPGEGLSTYLLNEVSHHLQALGPWGRG